MLAAIGPGSGKYYIYTSTNFGTSWSLSGAPNKSWTTVNTSADGQLLLGATGVGIYSSTNFGSTWQLTGAPLSITWIALAASANGSTLIAGGQSGSAYYSTNMGATWQSSGIPSLAWNSVVCSADGTKLAVASGGIGQIYTSTNSGASWNHYSISGGGGLRCSADGGQLLLTASTSSTFYYSSNWGVNWTTITTAMPSANSWGLALSADGKKWVTVHTDGLNGFINISTNLGATWTTNYAPNKSWGPSALSVDGSRMAIAVNNSSDKIFFWQPPSLIVTNSSSNLTFSWPTNGTAFKLQINTNLTSANWVNLPTVPTVINGMNQVIVARTNSNAFFRLISQ